MEIDVDNTLPLVDANLVKGIGRCRTGTVDQYIDCTKVLCGIGKGLLDATVIGNITDYTGRFLALGQ